MEGFKREKEERCENRDLRRTSPCPKKGDSEDAAGKDFKGKVKREMRDSSVSASSKTSF